MFRHILYAASFSRAAAGAFDQMLESFCVFKPKVTLLHCYRMQSWNQDIRQNLAYVTAADKLAAEIEAVCTQKLDLLEARLEEAGCVHDQMVLHGHAGQLIIETARNRLCDLIVMGCRGYDGFNAALLGSTSTYVLHHSPCPVLIIPQKHASLEPLST